MFCVQDNLLHSK